MVEPLKILIVDPEEPSRTFLEELLVSGRGHGGVSANSLEEALAALEQGPFDLVVMDLPLPAGPGGLPLHEHGYALEKAVRAQAPRAKGRTFLIVRAREGLSATDVSLAHDHGCDAFVTKRDRERFLVKLAEGEARAVARRAPKQRSKGLPLRVKSWRDGTIVLGKPALARTTAGAEVVVTPTEAVERVLYHLLFSEGASDLQELATLRTTRRSLARDARKFFRSVFQVNAGPDDPLPWERAQRAWVSRVGLRERGLDQVRGAYEEIRRRPSSGDEEEDLR